MGPSEQKTGLSGTVLVRGLAKDLASLASLWDALRARGLAVSLKPVRPGHSAWLGWPVRLAQAYLWRRQGLAGLVFLRSGGLSAWAGPATRLGIKVVRVYLPDESPPDPSFKTETRALARARGRAVCLNRSQAARLREQGLSEENARFLAPGVKAHGQARQDSIFSRLAHHNREGAYKKFFTLGAWTGLNGRERLEGLFQAVDKSRAVAANLQLIVIGDGQEKKNLAWLAKKVGIGDLTWFIGEPGNPAKWLEGLDAYVMAGARDTLEDLERALKAAACGRPVIAPEGSALEGLLAPGREALFCPPDDGEALAQAIIRLRQDKRLAEALGKAAKQRVEREYTIERMAEEFLKRIGIGN